MPLPTYSTAHADQPSIINQRQVNTMDTTTKALPSLPSPITMSANFANKPYTDISMLDTSGSGMLYTFIVSSSSSSSGDGSDDGGSDASDEPTPPPQPRHPRYRPHRHPPPRPAPPRSHPSPPRQAASNLSMMDRPRFTSKFKKGAAKDPFASVVPMPPTHPLASKPQPRSTAQRLRPRLPNTQEGADMLNRTKRQLENLGISEQLRLMPSFSQKHRIKSTLGTKRLGRLDIDMANPRTRKKPVNSPKLVLEAQQPLPAPPKVELVETSSKRSQSRRREQAPSRSPPSHVSSPVKPGVQSHDTSTSSGSEWVQDDSDMLDRPGQRRVYLPGPIKLEQGSSLLRKDSVANMDLLVTADVVPRGQRLSDMVANDNIVMFFEQFNLMHDATGESLDRYWLEETRDSKLVTRTRSCSDTVVEAEAQRARKQPSPSLSKFSLALLPVLSPSAVSLGALPSVGSLRVESGSTTTKQRSRTGLRKLWQQPVLSSSAFSRSSGKRPGPRDNV